MGKRSLVTLVVFVVFAVLIAYAVMTAQADGTELLFDSAAWLLLAAPFAGVLASGLTRRVDPKIEGDRVLRHDGAAILAHWTHGLGTALLLGTGLVLGFLFIPALLPTGEPVWVAMNIHFVAALVFLFGTFYYAANTWLSTYRLAEHLPTKNAIKFTLQHYGHMMGVKKFTELAPEDKYFESEKMAYILAVIATLLMVVTGIFKSLAHVVDIPAAVMGVMKVGHGVGMVLMLLFFVAHVTFGAILPFAWTGLRSMFTGYVPRDYAEKEHAGWYQRLAEGSDRAE